MNLLLTGCFKYTEEHFESFRSLGYDIHFIQQEQEELPLSASKVDAVVCNGLFISHSIDEFTNLKFIQLTSVGLDRVPVDKIKERQIRLFNARGVYNTPMAEWVVFRTLEHYKQGWFFKKEQTSKCWTKHRGLREITGIKMAIVGAGNIGQEVAKRFQIFGAETIGFDIHTNKTPFFDKMELISSLKERIGMFDVVVVTAPLLSSTFHLISREVLMSMKKNAVLVNIARGGLIDESCLGEVLQKRPDLFAALDVFEIEPLEEESPLWQLENVAISPHNSFVSDGNDKRMFHVIYNNLKNFIFK